MDDQRVDAGGITYEELYWEAEMFIYIIFSINEKGA